MKMKILLRVVYLVKVVCHDRKKVICGFLGDHVIEDANDHDEIRLRGVDFNFLSKAGRE